MVKSNGARISANGRMVQERAVVEAMREVGIEEDKVDKTMVTVAEPKLITLEEAIGIARRTYCTLQRWLRGGYLREYGREKFPARGGGKVLVSLEEVWYLAENPPRPGPKKNGRRCSMVRSNGGRVSVNGRMVQERAVVEAMREVGIEEDKIDKTMVTVAEPKLITLEEAAGIARRTYRTLQRWLRGGYLREYGREKFPARGGGKVLVSLEEVLYLAETPPRPGPKKNGA